MRKRGVDEGRLRKQGVEDGMGLRKPDLQRFCTQAGLSNIAEAAEWQAEIYNHASEQLTSKDGRGARPQTIFGGDRSFELATVIAGQRHGVCGMGITAYACPWSRAEPTQITTSNNKL